MSRAIVTDGRHIPEPVKKLDYWVLWDFETKQPLAPWLNGHSYPSEWRQDNDSDPRTSFDRAAAAADLGPELIHEQYPFPEGPPEQVGPTLLLPHEGDDTPGPTPDDPPLLFIDYDDVVSAGEIPDEVWDIAADIGGPLFGSRSFLAGEDPAGLHQLARGSLPGAVTTVNAELDTRGHIEIYYRSRMTGFTWLHVRGTPTDTLPNATDPVAYVIETYGKESTRRRAGVDPDQTADAPDLSDLTPPDELADMDTTDDIEDIFSAIRHIGPRDISLRSELTEETGNRKSYDPSWESSKSGTRLGYDQLRGGENWIYREGSHPVDALQVVAAEEGIIRDVTNYPEDDDFWRAVQALRERGAAIPYYTGQNGRHPDVLRLYERADDPDEKRGKALRLALASGLDNSTQ